MKLSGALNRILSLLSMKTGSKQEKKDRFSHRPCLPHPGDPGQMLEVAGPSPIPRHYVRSACKLAPGKGQEQDTDPG